MHGAARSVRARGKHTGLGQGGCRVPLLCEVLLRWEARLALRDPVEGLVALDGAEVGARLRVLRHDGHRLLRQLARLLALPLGLLTLLLVHLQARLAGPRGGGRRGNR